ncbi:sensor histidine kinase [Sulfitobacter sp. S190]|uniref:sensor histidine kinase n=1 Tax=Sulfitobacter sp. S190 TaxID=2867022 RepID=UPI0021A8130A|nr:sensor histidine kinase [Sulfitobacter sp. S190]
MSLIAVTEQAVATERTILQEAFGAGQALASIVKLVRTDPETCSSFMRTYMEGSGRYRLVGFIGRDGLMSCSSHDAVFDFSTYSGFGASMDTPARSVSTNPLGPISREAVVLVNVPVFENDVMVGYVVLSIAQANLNALEPVPLDHDPVAVITFSDEGKILSSGADQTRVTPQLPRDYTLKQLTGENRQVFEVPNAEGTPRVYAIVPLIPGKVFAMSIWPIDTPFLETDFSGRISSLLPVLMWLASLVVAFWALHRLAITHIRKLGRQMRHFALNRTLPRHPLGERVPHEIVAMEQSFLGMADSILQDEARSEDNLRQKNILLKEVHHRVKNNLQLISSIMNMQIRQAPTEANRMVLQRLQDRILSLATVHKNLYQDNEMTRVDGGALLKEIVARNLAVGLSQSSGVQVTEDYDDIMVGPDDAAPLTLLVSEAVTNALKYVPQGEGHTSNISVSLKYVGPEEAELRVVNTSGGEPPEGGTGLGSRLILAFARQLNGELSTRDDDGVHVLSLRFPVPSVEKQVYDY